MAFDEATGRSRTPNTEQNIRTLWHVQNVCRSWAYHDEKHSSEKAARELEGSLPTMLQVAILLYVVHRFIPAIYLLTYFT